MSKFPRLEQMRSQRAMRENELIAPYRIELSAAAQSISALKATIRAIERAVGTEIGKRILEQVGYQISGKIRELIYGAVAKASGRAPDALVNVALPMDILRFSDPRSIETEVLNRYARETTPRLSLRIDARPSDMATIIDIRVPELGCRHVIAA